MSLFSRKKTSSRKTSSKKSRARSPSTDPVTPDQAPQGGQQIEEGGLGEAVDEGFGGALGSFASGYDALPPPEDPDKAGGKGRKKRLKKGTELTKHKGGTSGAHEDFLQLMHMGDDERVTALHALLTERRAKGNQLFYHLQMRLGGANSDLPDAYERQTGQRLAVQIRERLTTEQADYLGDVIAHGEPSLQSRLKMAMGTITGSKCDSAEVITIFEAAKDEEKLQAWGQIGPLLTQKLKDKAPRLEAQVETLTAKEALPQAFQDRMESEPDWDPVAMLDHYDKELVAIGESCVGKAGLKRDKLAEVLPDWAAAHTTAARAYVTRKESRFYAFLNEHRKDLLGRAFTHADKVYVLDMIRNATPVSDDFFNDGVEEDALEGKAKKKRNKARREEGAEQAELRAYMTRKESTASILKGSDAFETFVERVEGMSEEQKEDLVKSYMSDQDRKDYEDDGVSHRRKLEIREEALHEGLRMQLKAMGMRGGRGLTPLRKRVLVAFTYGAAENTINSQGTYQRLVSHSKGHKVDRKAFGQKALTLIRKLRGDEFAQVRGDSELMRRLRKKAPKKYVRMIHQALGLTVGEQDGGEGNALVDPLNDESREGGRELDLDTARQVAVDEAELQPSHWAIAIRATVKDSRLKRRTEVNSLITRAWEAGKRRERMTAAGPASLSGSRTLSPMTAQEFVQAVDKQLSKGARKALKARGYTVALEALAQGRRPDVDAQIGDAKYRNPFKRTSGARLSADRVEGMVEDLNGRDLLDEWSNIEDLRRLAKVRDSATGMPRDAIDEEIRTFVIRIRKDRQDWLKKNLPPADLVDVVGTVQDKLASAMASDPEVAAILDSVGYANDELSQAKTSTLGLLDAQKQRSTGAQYNTYRGPTIKNPLTGKQEIGASSKSAQAKESTGTLLGRTRAAESALDGGEERSKVVEDKSKGIQDAQKELKRRGKAFDEMQKKYNALAKKMIKFFLRAVITTALGALTAVTGPLGGALAVVVMGTKVLLMETLMKVATAQLEGDAHNTTEAIFDVAFKTFAATAGGVAQELLGPVLTDAFQLPTYEEDGITHIGHDAHGTTPLTPGQAALGGVVGGMKKTTKSLLMMGINELRATDDRAHRGTRVAAGLGGLVLTLGSRIGKQAAGAWEEQVASSGTREEQAGAGAVAKVAKQSKYGVKFASKALKDLAKPPKTKHGDDRASTLHQLTGDTVVSAVSRLDAIDEQLRDARDGEAEGVDTEALQAEHDAIVAALKTLEDAWIAWRDDEDTTTYEDGEVEVSSKTSPVLQATLALRDTLGMASLA